MPRVPYTFLIPGARIQPKSTFSTGRTPILLELRPFEDDGQHWVLFSNGEVARVPIDRALVEKYTLTITPLRRPSGAAARPAEPRMAHKLMALRRDAAATSVTVTLRDRTSSATRDVRWTLNGGTTDRAVLGEWAAARALEWYPLAMQTHSPILQAWIDRTSELYGDGAAGLSSELPRLMRFGAGMDRSASAFDVLGGRAAVRETLQMELMRSRGNAPPRTAAGVVPIATLKGVDVAGLPFDQLLAGKPGGRLALADFAPEDRLFVYFAKPSAVFPFLNQGGDMLGRSGSAMTATAFDDDLKRRYLRRLGLPEESSRKLLESGAITELAITAPDLFFIDGTDLTVLMRLRAPDAAVALGALAGVNLAGAAIVARPTTGGRSAYWARQGDVLAVSTSRREIEEALRLGQAARGSLGRSAELRYMLTQLPVQKETRALIYLSDPFIRRMVGPSVKIGQLRRVRAAAEMSLITAGALLYRLDGHTDAPDLATLARLGYVPQDVARPDYRVQPDLSVVSQKWGTLAELTTIATAATETATREEADAYQTYVEEYRRYWRQFFDPIAMRLDDAPDGALELTTFILPLIDSELYTAVAGLLGAMNKPLRVPHTKPEPVFQLSLNLSDDAWAGLSSGFRDMFSQFTGHQPRAVRHARAGPAHRHPGRRPDHLVRHVGSAGRVRRVDVRSADGHGDSVRAVAADAPVQDLHGAAGPSARARADATRRERRRPRARSRRRLPPDRQSRRVDLHLRRARHRAIPARARDPERLPRRQQHPVVGHEDDRSRRHADAEWRGDPGASRRRQARPREPVRDTGRAGSDGGAHQHGGAVPAAEDDRHDAGRGGHQTRRAVRDDAAPSWPGRRVELDQR